MNPLNHRTQPLDFERSAVLEVKEPNECIRFANKAAVLEKHLNRLCRKRQS
jgi:hypothetical protein